MDLIIGNEGLNHLAVHIFNYLDFSSLKQCRLVCKSWRMTIDEDQVWWLLQLQQILSLNKLDEKDEWNQLFGYYKRKKGSLDLIQTLLKSTKEYLDLNPASIKESILLWTVKNQKIEALQALAPTYDLNETDIYGRTALHWACKLNHHQIIAFLLDLKNSQEINVNANADIRGQSPFHWACKYGNVETVQLLLQYSRIDFNATDQAGQTGLYAAIGEGKIDVVKVLIHSEKIDFNATDALGMTPLHWSCFYHYSNISPRIYEDIVKLLLRLENINVNATDMKGRTPEDLAKLREFHGITKILNQKD